MSDARKSFQQGSYEQTKRAYGPDAWEFRWRERQSDGTWKPKRKVVGTVKDYPTLAEAKLANQSFVAAINAKQQEPVGKLTIAGAWGHFQKYELCNPTVDRSETTIQGYLDYFKNYILPQWGETPVDDIDAATIEDWFATLTVFNGKRPAAPATKAKIRNHLSALFHHLVRRKLWQKPNPIEEVRQSAKRKRIPTTLTVKEIAGALLHIESDVIRVMVTVAAGSALRRSEIVGLKWRDLDFENLWFNLERGVVGMHVTKMKTEASRLGLPMLPELRDLLQEWRRQTPYPADDHWVFASPFTKGERPYWPDIAMKHHVRPAAAKAGITKHLGWHSFRHSVATLLNANGENVKTIQELLRHANSRITLETYIQGDVEAKRRALQNSMSALFVVSPLTKAS